MYLYLLLSYNCPLKVFHLQFFFSIILREYCDVHEHDMTGQLSSSKQAVLCVPTKWLQVWPPDLMLCVEKEGCFPFGCLQWGVFCCSIFLLGTSMWFCLFGWQHKTFWSFCCFANGNTVLVFVSLNLKTALLFLTMHQNNGEHDAEYKTFIFIIN